MKLKSTWQCLKLMFMLILKITNRRCHVVKEREFLHLHNHLKRSGQIAPEHWFSSTWSNPISKKLDQMHYWKITGVTFEAIQFSINSLKLVPNGGATELRVSKFFFGIVAAIDQDIINRLFLLCLGHWSWIMEIFKRV